MEKMFVICEKEMEIQSMEISLLSNQLFSSLYLESVDNQSNIKSIIDKIIKKIKAMIEKVKETCMKIFKSEKYNTLENKLEEKCKNDPSFRNKKVEIIDYDKLEKLNDTTEKELIRSKDRKPVFEKYLTKRKIILGTTAIVTVGFLLKKLKKKRSLNDKEYTRRRELLTDMLKKEGMEIGDLWNAEWTLRKNAMHVEINKTIGQDLLSIDDSKTIKDSIEIVSKFIDYELRDETISEIKDIISKLHAMIY